MNLKGMNDLKPGDKVFVRTGYGFFGLQIHKVSRVTPKQFIVQISETYQRRFRKRDGMELGGYSSTWNRDHAYPYNEENVEEYKQTKAEYELIQRHRNLMVRILEAVKKAKIGGIEKLEHIAEILEIEDDDS